MKSALNQLPIIGDNTGKTLKTTNNQNNKL